MQALSPLDGRYASKVDSLRAFFSEEALIRARIFVEVKYFQMLAATPAIKDLKALKPKQKEALDKIIRDFTQADADAVKKIEARTNHDVKAVEYFLKEKFQKLGLKKSLEFVHFGLTSEDVNNLAYGILIHKAIEGVIAPWLKTIIR